nr:type VI secretion system accessory protein TagJ [Lysobacter enzymogenes]
MALAQAEAAAGEIDGVAFQWLCDADPRFGPCLEVVLETGYAWIAFAQLSEVVLDAPVSLRDLLWQPATLVWRNGDAVAGLVPCRYPGSEHSEHIALRLGRRTDWSGDAAAARGLGQRMLLSDRGEHPLLEIRRIRFDPPPGEAAAWPS